MGEKIKVVDGKPVCPMCGTVMLHEITHDYWGIPVYSDGKGLTTIGGTSSATDHVVDYSGLYCTSDSCGYQVEGFLEDFEIVKGEDNV